MTSLRKVQLLAAAVIVNGMIALTAMSPQEAHAAACPSTTSCAASLACIVMEHVCVPPSGCQFVGGTCGESCGSWPVQSQLLTCNYAPL